MARALGLGLLWIAVVGAAAPLPLTPPPPDLTALVPFAWAPLDKPAIAIPEIPLPGPPVDVAPIPPAPLALPAAERPIAFISPPRGFPCAVKFFSESQSLECGKEKFLKEEYEDAVKALESIRGAKDRDLLIEARYWLGESLLRLGRVEQADWAFRQAAGDTPRQEYQIWAAHAAGWTALRLGDPARARGTFKKLLSVGIPAPIEGWTRHGLALAHGALGDYSDARQVWAELGRRGTPAALGRDVAFWYGETLGRLGDYAGAEAELRKFTEGGPHPLFDAGLVRLGWWTLAGGRAAESVAPFRTYLGSSRRIMGAASDADWARAGLAFALSATGDWEGARGAAQTLDARKSSLGLAVTLRLVRAAVDAGKAAEAGVMIQELLATNITPPGRAWLLATSADAQRIGGNRDEARTQYDLAQQADPSSPLALHAALRLARTNFEMREFAQAVSDVTQLLGSALPADLRAAALLLQGEAAYNAGDHAVAASAFRRALVEFPQSSEAPAIRLALGWIALRQREPDAARRLFLEYAAAAPGDPRVADALELAAELALAAGDFDAARPELDRLIASYSTHPRSDFARLNRAILMVRSGKASEALAPLRDWIARVSFPPLLGRAEAALGAALLAAKQPAEAGKEFGAARREGVGAFASLGVGAAAMASGRWSDAEEALVDARDTGTAEITRAAEFALAGVAFQRGATREFKEPALAALRDAPTSTTAPRLLYVLTGIAVDEKDWTGALGYAKRLVTEFPRDEAADDALERAGRGAAVAKVWPVAYEAYALLSERYPSSPFREDGWRTLAEAQLQTGRAADARRDLEQRVASSPNDAQAWILLARARDATGDRPAALEAYVRAGREGMGPDVMREAWLGNARLLVIERRWEEARAVLDRLLRGDDQSAVVDAAHGIGDTYRNEGDHLAAAEYYMTAAYLAPESLVGRRSLLAAAESFTALRQPDAAAIVYKKLLAQRDVPRDLADAARQGLQTLGR